MSENVKVMVRCRPFISRQQEQRSTKFLKIERDFHEISIKKPKGISQQSKVFTFDHIFGPQCSQSEIYEQTTFLLVEKVLQGYNGTIFAYGQTGCGKTYTMSGGNSEQTRGIIPRTFKQIITTASIEKQKKHLIQCSYIEIYNEDIYDLLDKKAKNKLELVQTPGKGVFIKDHDLRMVKSFEEIKKLFDIGSKNRSIRGTALNKYSSRSHCVFTIHVESSEEDGKGNELFKAAKLNLVDLAGSERQSKIKMAGQGLKQTTRINLSLSALGNVISALANSRSTHIPFRDSKLTRLLQDSLGGNTHTIMIATISPIDSSFEETLSTLRYASRAKFIKNKPKINEDPKDALLRQYASQIKRLKNILQNINPHLLNDAREPVDPLELEEYKRSQEREKQEKLKLAQKLKQLQSLLSKQEVEEDQNQIEKINQLRSKLKYQKQKEEEYLREKKQRQNELLEIQTNYKSLNDEVDELRKRFVELKQRYIQAQQQIKDLRQVHEEEKESLLNLVREQDLQISKYKGITHNILVDQQIEFIIRKSRINEEQKQWIITPFKLKENIVIFPQETTRSFQNIGKSEKINMLMSQSKNKKNSSLGGKKELTDLSYKYQTNFNQPNKKATQVKRNASLCNFNDIKPGRDLAPLKKQPSGQNLKVEEKKKLNINLGQLKMDILTQLTKKQQIVSKNK